MKKTITLSLLMLAASVTLFAQSKIKVYYNVINNPSKTIDYTIGVYPGDYAYHTPDNIDPYSSLRMRIINNSSETLKWNERNRVFILMNDGTMICNYLTQATDGEKVNGFTLYKDDSHDATLCFSEKFDVSDIKKMWIYDAPHDQIFELSYDEIDSK